jgi:glycosyltransferase involved in cell wall biosynthesis
VTSLPKIGETESVLIAIPCLNESATISDVVHRIRAELKSIDEYEILVIDDGSGDNSAELAMLAGANVLSHPATLGLGEVFVTARNYFMSSHHRLLVTFDADGQFSEHQIPLMISKSRVENLDFLSGSRFLDAKNHDAVPRAKRYGNVLFAIFASLSTGKQFTDTTCGFRCYSELALCHLQPTRGFSYTHESLIQLASSGLKMGEMPIEVRYFQNRESRIAANLLRYGFAAVAMFLKTLVKNSPSRLLAISSVVTGAISASLLTLLFMHYSETGRFTGMLFAGFIGGGLAGATLLLALAAVVGALLTQIRRTTLEALALARLEIKLRRQEGR